MRAAQHWLVGYDRQTELEEYELAIPDRFFREVETFVHFDKDDPDVIGSYEVTTGQALQIARMIGNVSRLPPPDLDFFIQAYHASLAT
jgi:hypothetical protein